MRRCQGRRDLECVYVAADSRNGCDGAIQMPLSSWHCERAVTRRSKRIPKNTAMSSSRPSEVNYGWTFPIWLEHEEKGGLEAKNRKIHIVQEQIAYCQTISKAAQEAIKKRGKFEVARITDIQYPVQDWANVIREMKEVDAGTIMVDHWVAAEYGRVRQAIRRRSGAELARLPAVRPVTAGIPDAGRRRGERLLLEHRDRRLRRRKGAAFRAKYKKRFPGVMGLAYTGIAYDFAYILKQAWEGVGDPRKFKEVCAGFAPIPRGAFAATTT